MPDPGRGALIIRRRIGEAIDIGDGAIKVLVAAENEDRITINVGGKEIEISIRRLHGRLRQVRIVADRNISIVRAELKEEKEPRGRQK